MVSRFIFSRKGEDWPQIDDRRLRSPFPFFFFHSQGGIKRPKKKNLCTCACTGKSLNVCGFVILPYVQMNNCNVEKSVVIFHQVFPSSHPSHWNILIFMRPRGFRYFIFIFFRRRRNSKLLFHKVGIGVHKSHNSRMTSAGRRWNTL